MTDTFSLKTSGMKELFREIDSLPLKMKKKVYDPALRSSGRILVLAARRNVDKIVASGKKWKAWKDWKGQTHRPGTLKKKITVNSRKGGRGFSRISVGVKKGAAYAIPLEMGHVMYHPKAKKKIAVHVPAYPFLRPTLETERERVIEEFANKARQVLGKVGKI